MSGPNSFKIVSLNVKGLCNRQKRLSIFRWLKKIKSDISFIQEAHCSPDIESQWRREWGGDIMYAHGTSNSRGCLVLFNNNFDYEIK